MSVPISVLIPSVDGGNRLVALAEELISESPQVEVVIADNGLDSKTTSRLRTAGAKLVSMGGNAGFGRAVNAAAACAEGDVLIVTNDDIEPYAGFAVELAAPVLAGAEMAAGILVHREHPGVIESAGLVIDPLLGWHDHLRGEPLEGLERRSPLPNPLGPSGGASAFSTEAFRAMEGYDEAFFAYAEDIDLALRLRRAGARCEVASRSRAVHLISATLVHGSLAKAAIVGHSRGHLLRKYGVLARPGRGAVALSLELVATTTLALRHRSLRPAAARVRGWRASAVREPFPPRGWVDVSVVGGMRRRLAWFLRRPMRRPGALL